MSTVTYTITPRQANVMLGESIDAGLVPFLRSSPGQGKSAIVRSIADARNLVVIDFRLSMADPTDMSGLPFAVNGKSKFLPFDVFPIEGDPIPEGKDGWLLFLDEFNSTTKAVQAAAYKLTLDREVGQYKLHPAVKIIAAGNLDTDKAITNPMSTAMMSRLVHLDMKLNFQEFMEDVAYPFKWDSRLVAFLEFSNDSLYTFNPNDDQQKGKTYSCPRTLEFLHRLIDGKDVKDSLLSLYVGTVGEATASRFLAFSKVYQHIPDFDQILRDPKNTTIPSKKDAQYAVVTSLVEKTDNSNILQVFEYVKRLGVDFQIAFSLGVQARNKNGVRTATWSNWNTVTKEIATKMNRFS